MRGGVAFITLMTAIVGLTALATAIALPIVTQSDISPDSWVAQNQVSGLYDIGSERYTLHVSEVPASVDIYSGNGNSMLPAIADGSKVLVMDIEDKTEINVGDIITFEADIFKVTHRVMEKGYDSEGLYFVTKGDYNIADDMNAYGKVRPSQIKGVVIGIIY